MSEEDGAEKTAELKQQLCPTKEPETKRLVQRRRELPGQPAGGAGLSFTDKNGI